MNKLTMNSNRAFMLIGLCILAFYFIFSPAINTLYYSGDDYRYALGGLGKSCSNDDGFYFMQTLGRPVQAYLDCMNYKLGDTLQHMRLVRLGSVILMAIVAGLFAEWLCCLGFSMGAAFFAASTVLLIHQLYSAAVLMGANTIIFPLLFVLIANFYANRSAKILPAVLIFIALLTYPAMTFFYVTLLLSRLLFSNISDWIETRRDVIRQASMFFFVCCLYFVYAYLNIRYNAKAPVPDAYQVSHPNLNPVEFFRRFIFLSDVYNAIWALFASGANIIQGRLTIALLTLGAICGSINLTRSRLYVENKKTALRYVAEGVVLVVALFILSSAFILVIPSFEFVLNTGERWLLFGTISAELVLAFWCVKQIAYIFPLAARQYIITALLGLLFCIAGYQANLDSTAKALGFAEYTSYQQEKISDYLAKNKLLRRVHVIVPKSEYPYDSFFSTNVALMQVMGKERYNLQWCSLPRGVPGEEKDHQHEAVSCINTLPKDGVAVTYSYPDDAYVKTDNMLVIDIRHASNREFYYKQALKKYFGIEGWGM